MPPVAPEKPGACRPRFPAESPASGEAPVSVQPQPGLRVLRHLIPAAFPPQDWKAACAPWTLAWPQPRATPQPARGTEQPFFSPAAAGPEGTLCSGGASRAANTHPSRHRPRCRPWGYREPGTWQGARCQQMGRALRPDPPHGCWAGLGSPGPAPPGSPPGAPAPTQAWGLCKVEGVGPRALGK